MKLNTRMVRKQKLRKTNKSLQMLTCYDFQTAQLLNQTDVDLILVGDSLGNVILGYETTVEVSLEEMIIFGSAVKRGAKDKFVVTDLPFGSYATFESAINNAIKLFQSTRTEALKLEGADPHHIDIITRLISTGIPIMGHIGLTPQSVHELGGYYTHGKNQDSKNKLLTQAKKLESAGVFALVLECVEEELATQITNDLSIPVIGIGAGPFTDGQVLVTNDLLQIGDNKPPKFCQPIANFYEMKKVLIDEYICSNQQIHQSNENVLHH